ncbi:hypothetical protein TRFO_13445 [Tritrichomonas foetus]|uniref:Uncharacterized protein n=1 Tax=Tritrichomonas foetus TaxID=1144522 RepID=A0A1J4KY08_9EUKA|nr:hypothetical protein TRFO_13445 [Tritrichomonas foetus]|eukprot:OHT16119.1 hypothetical protein TRFO_13445 [Tritrichomonas foetus]
MSKKASEASDHHENENESNYFEQGVECLGNILDLSPKRFKLFNYNTAFDAYLEFIEDAKRKIPIRDLRQTFPNSKSYATHEMILTPSFVCYLAMRRLRRLLEVEQFPPVSQISEPPLELVTETEKSQNENVQLFHPKSRDQVSCELAEFTCDLTTDIDLSIFEIE